MWLRKNYNTMHKKQRDEKKSSSTQKKAMQFSCANVMQSCRSMHGIAGDILEEVQFKCYIQSYHAWK
jgi:hypothetical protein